MIEGFPYPAEEYLLLGKIAKAHGLRGEVKISLYSGQPENLRGYRELFLIDRRGKMSGPLTLLGSRDQGKSAIVRFASVTDRNQAEAMEGLGVLLAKADLPEIAEDEYYWHQYLGKTVVDVGGKTLGRVEHLMRTGPQDVLVIKSAAGDEEILIPITREILVGETAGTLTVDPPPGLLELNSGL